jgi:hypothetical protein
MQEIAYVEYVSVLYLNGGLRDVDHATEAFECL